MSAPLEQWQADFAAALLDADRAPALLPRLLTGDTSRLHDRLDLYRRNIAAAREQALANAYPVVRTLVGKEFFVALARAYGRAHPSISGDLNLFGARLPTFVGTFERTQSLPYLTDVAALEWAVHRAQYAVDADPVARGQIAGLSPQGLLAAKFALHPACAWFSSRFPVGSIWLAHQPQTDIALPDTLERGEFALVVRRDWVVSVLVSSAGEVAALAQLRSGASMDAAIDAAQRAEPTFDFAKAIMRWLDHALLVAVPQDLSGATA